MPHNIVLPAASPRRRHRARAEAGEAAHRQVPGRGRRRGVRAEEVGGVILRIQYNLAFV